MTRPRTATLAHLFTAKPIFFRSDGRPILRLHRVTPFTLRAVLALALLSPWIQADDRDLIIVAGQSNAVGFDALASELPPSDADREILFWWRVGDPPPDQHDVTSGNRWTHLQAQPQGSPRVTQTPDEKKATPRQYGNFAFGRKKENGSPS
jgi:hypothetical protein